MYCKKLEPFINALNLFMVLVVLFAGSLCADLQDDIIKFLIPIRQGPTNDAVVDTVCDMIQKGQFQDAHQVLEDSSDLSDRRLDQVRTLISEYDRIMELRKVANKKGLGEQTKELNELKLGPRIVDPNDVKPIAKAQIPEPEPVGAIVEIPEFSPADLDGDGDVDMDDKQIFVEQWLAGEKAVRTEPVKEEAPVAKETPAEKVKEPKGQEAPVVKKELTDAQQAAYISDIFATSLKAAEYADPNEKQKLLADPFIIETIEKALALARKFESQGKWVDAYAHCYYWLIELDKDNKQYKEHGEMLTEMAMIEMSLMDNSCETSIKRHEGIKENMLIRAIKALDFNYINVIDYAQMANDGIEQAHLLGEVIARSDKELAYQADTVVLEKWSTGLEIIKTEVNSPKNLVTVKKFVWAFDEILELNDKTMKLPKEVLIAQFSKAALKSLDPYTSLVWPWEVKDFQKTMTNEFPGIGIRISKARGVLTAVSLIPNTPAYDSGLDAGDSILAINGESTDDMTLTCAVSKITGPVGTPVTLTIRHKGSDKDETEDLTITRGKVVVPTIQGWQRAAAGKWWHIIDPLNKIGYARITAFSEYTVPDMEKALNELEKDGLNGLVIDLRFNSGGYLSAAAGIVNLFVDHGLIVKSQPRWGVPSYETAHKKGTHPGYPIVVLINGGSASASEIVAGALQDDRFKRAVIVGQRSYGKGSVQTITSFPGEGSQLKYTMAYYHLPSNQPVKNRYVMEKLERDDWGIAPDVEVKIELRTKEGQKMLKTQNANEILAKADHDEVLNPVKRFSLQETIDSDPQLAVSLLILKSKIVQSGKDIRFPEPERIETPIIAEGKVDF